MNSTHTPHQLHYTQTGTGPDILFVHGWVSSERMWTPLVEELSANFRCWAVDLIGFGASPHPSETSEADIETHTRSLIEFCDAHAIHPVAIIGHSMGGMLTLNLALMRPDLAERLVLIAPVVTGRFGRPVVLKSFMTSAFGDYALSHFKTLWSMVQSDVIDAFTPLLTTPGFVNEATMVRVRQDVKRASWQAAASGLRSIARQDLGPRLREIRQPALVIVGSNDMTVPPEESRYAARHLPEGRLLEIPNISHQALDDAPRPVISAVRDFLTER